VRKGGGKGGEGGWARRRVGGPVAFFCGAQPGRVLPAPDVGGKTKVEEWADGIDGGDFGGKEGTG